MHNVKFLLWIDNPAFRACVTMLLDLVRCDVAVAEDGLEALLIYERAPDILVSDLNMRRMFGFDLLSKVGRRLPHIVTIGMIGGYRNGNDLPPEVMAPPRKLCGTLAQLVDGIPAPSA